MKIYTKTGDKGYTSLIGGKRVPKYHERIDAYGTVDELMAFIALLKDQEGVQQYDPILLHILDRLMCCASILAADCSDCKVKIPTILDSDIGTLENAIDRMEEALEPLSSFVLPGGHQSVSLCHVARTVCRRAERLAIKANSNGDIPETAIRYLNRLSDFLFVLSRSIAKKLGVKQNLWKAKV